MTNIKHLDENIFIINNFIDDTEYKLILDGDIDYIKLKISTVFNNKYIVNGSGIIKELKVGEFLEIHSDQHSENCRCGYCILGNKNKKIYGAALYLNEDYDGGEINYVDKFITYKPSSNSIIFHPASEEYRHQVFPVKSGIRKSLSFFLIERGYANDL